MGALVAMQLPAIAIYLALALACASPASGQDLLVEKESGRGATDIFIVNQSNVPIAISKIVINRRQTPECTLVPVEGRYGATMIRGDWNETPKTQNMVELLGERRAVSVIELVLGEELTAVSPSTCGRVIELEVFTDQGTTSFAFR